MIEADIKYPTDAGLASHGVRALAREGRKLAALVGEQSGGCGIARGRWAGGCGRSAARSAGAPGEAKAEVLKLTGRPASC